ASFSVLPRVIGGRYGLASKEFTPAMAVAVFDVMERSHPPAHFTIGIHDDVTGLSIPWDPSFSIDAPDTVSALFYGLGSDGTVGANKNSIKIIGETTPLHAQGYFVYDSKKSGSVTISHLRFGTRPIRAPYLISTANFIACHQFQLLDHLDVLGSALPSGTFLLNSPYGPDEVWAKLPHAVRDTIASKRLRFFVIDGDRVARETRRLRRSVIRSRRPTASGASALWLRISRLSMQRWPTYTRSRCRTRSPFQSPMRSRTALVDVHWISRPDLAT
ncbi:MAG: 2-oxoacid:acceptor oxidoreductase family protein, partial [Chloroflexi bacterium]|nr:2-oxoacid:acceptor oxidoreductase family protein [Chloroflexota bacterium]